MSRLIPAILIATAFLASACARNAPIDVPSLPDPGYSGLGPGGLDGTGGLGAQGDVAGGTLPGTNISDTVLFEVDQTTLTPQGRALLDAQVGWLTQNPGGPIEIQGHADERGTREYNLALGSGRASSVRNYLVSRGVPDRRVSIITFGRERPAATCAEERCWAQNRRSVTVVTPTGSGV